MMHPETLAKKLAEMKAARKQRAHTVRLKARRLRYQEVVKERKRAIRAANALIRAQRDADKAQRRAEREAKFQAKEAKKKKLPKRTQEFIDGFEAGKRFVLEGLKQ